MAKPGSIIVLGTLVLLMVFLAIPAADLAETAYDESGSQPYESVPVFSAMLLSGASPANERQPSLVNVSARACRDTAAQTDNARHNCGAGRRVTPTFFCTLLC